MKVIDLTRPLRNGEAEFSSLPAKRVEDDGWDASTLTIYSHSGTHMDAPLHFRVSSQGIGEINPENFIADCHIVDLRGIAPRTQITSSHLGSLKSRHRNGEGLLFMTGWSRFFGNNEVYRNSLPGISEELAVWCANAGVSIIGVETPSVADVNNIPGVTLIHTILLRAGIIIVEGLVNLDQISSERVRFIALPLKIENGDGSPCRAIAIEYSDETVSADTTDDLS